MRLIALDGRFSLKKISFFMEKNIKMELGSLYHFQNGFGTWFFIELGYL